ncbi:MAG: hypothetical protein ACK5N0_08665 [Synechococcaceae cyanobacterium]
MLPYAGSNDQPPDIAERRRGQLRRSADRLQASSAGILRATSSRTPALLVTPGWSGRNSIDLPQAPLCRLATPAERLQCRSDQGLTLESKGGLGWSSPWP